VGQSLVADPELFGRFSCGEPFHSLPIVRDRKGVVKRNL
jgi:hypothetical protein